MAQVVKEWVESRLTKERNASEEGLQQFRTESDQKVHTVCPVSSGSPMNGPCKGTAGPFDSFAPCYTTGVCFEWTVHGNFFMPCTINGNLNIYVR